jgi:hypothetical protein
MSNPNPRQRWLAVAAAGVVAIVVIVIVIVIVGGGDDGEDTPSGDALGVVASTAPTSPTSAAPVPDQSADAGDGTADAGPTTDTPATPAPADPDDATTDEGATTGDTAPTGTDPTDTAATPTPAAPPGSLVTVPTGTVAIADPIPPDEVGDFGTGVTAEIVTIEAVEGVARLPGEIGGPALRVRVRLTNASDDAVNLSRVLVDVTYGPGRTPGLALGEPGAEPFVGELPAGRSAEGVYVFGVPVDERGQVQVSVSYDVAAPIVVFEGPSPRA